MPTPPDPPPAPAPSDATLITNADDPALERAVAQLDGWVMDRTALDALADAAVSRPGVRAVLVMTDDPVSLRAVVERAHSVGIPVVVACADDVTRRRAVDLRAEEWYRCPADPDEISQRIRAAVARGTARSAAVSEHVERVEYERMLVDGLTGLPTLPVTIERSRALFKERGELVILYLNFVRYTKVEEIYGWEKLDAVLETTAASVREFLDETSLQSSRLTVAFTNDDDFIFFHVPAPGVPAASESEITEMVSRLQRHVATRIEIEHGEDIAALFDIYVGRALVHYNPKIKLERLIYRGLREAAIAARGIEERERGRRIADLRSALRERAVYIDYHPIVVTETLEIFGYEALARCAIRSLRSPEVMFDVAAEADLVWELSRLCRSRAIEGLETRLQPDELLFLNVDPQDFSDPAFNEKEVLHPNRVVIELTERTAIKDYPKFRERLRAFREKGVRFAVDDAGSGYAGLGSIANLEPDFIKLDLSLINGIDSNFIKQNLVETMVRFADDHGAKVIAEGVERPEELATVKRLGVHLVQGFLLHRPSSVPVSAARRAAASR